MTKDQTVQRFTRFLTAYPCGSDVSTLRKVALRACLREVYKVERVTDVPESRVEDLATALTVPYLPGSPITTPTPGPAFNMAHAGRLHEMTGIPSDICIVFLEGKAEDCTLSQMVSRIATKRGDETRSYAAQLAGKLSSAYRQIEAEEADAKGELWHVRAAIYADRVFMVLKQGFEPEGWGECFESQHQRTHAFAEKRIIGNQHEAQIEALKLFRTDETTIRVLRK